MPNHVTHRVVITGPSAVVEAFKAECIRPTEDAETPRLDFTALVPVPEIIDQTESSSTVSNGLVILGRTDLLRGSGRSIETMLEWPWVKDAGVTEIEGLKRLLMEQTPDCIEKAEIAIRAYEETGHPDWYSWRIANWGTKWNAYSFQIVADEPGTEGRHILELRFDTAWSPPAQIFKKIAERYPEMTVSITAFDEGWMFAYVAQIANGTFRESECEANDQLYELVYGEPPEREDDEVELVAPAAH